MSVKHSLSLDLLPAEILYCIFDFLDAETIFFNVGLTCKQLHAASKTYHRHNLNFRNISKQHFQCLCRWIDKSHVTSLVLSDSDRTTGQVQCFISAHALLDYQRLHSLTLHHIDNQNLEQILDQIHGKLSIRSLKICMKIRIKCSDTVLTHLSSILRQKTLNRLDLNLNRKHDHLLRWPKDGCSLKYLRWMNEMEYVFFTEILQSSPNLHTIILRDVSFSKDFIGNYENTFDHVRSLSLIGSHLNMHSIENVLLLTPCLNHLYLNCRGKNLIDGHRWTIFIGKNLRQLDRFELHFSENYAIKLGTDSSNALLEPFRSPFWLEIKRWYVGLVQCSEFRWIHLYSATIVKDRRCNGLLKPSIECSTAPATTSQIRFLDSITELDLDLRILLENSSTVEMTSMSSQFYHFPNVTSLSLHIQSNLPNVPIQYRSSLVNLTLINQLNISFQSSHELESIKTQLLKLLLEQMPNLRSLIIDNVIHSGENICSMDFPYLQHVELNVTRENIAFTILDRFTRLFSAAFTFIQGLRSFPVGVDNFKDSDDIADAIIGHLHRQRRIFSYKKEGQCILLRLWLNPVT